jgi:hypothetical protein
MDGGLCCPAPLGSALAAAEVYLDAAKANAVGRVGGCIDRGEDPPSSALPFDDFIPSFPKRTKWRWNPAPIGVGTIIALENPPMSNTVLASFSCTIKSPI